MSSIEIVRSTRELAALGDEWNVLAAAFGSPLMEHEWMLSSAEAFHGDGQLRVAIVRAGSRIEAIAPIGFERTEFGWRLTNLGASHLHEPTGWLFRSSSALAQLIDGVLHLRHPLVLQRIADDSLLCQMLHEQTAWRAVTMIRRSAPSLAVSTRGSWEDYYRGLSSRITSNLPRLRRKAERTLGAMNVATCTPDASQVDGLLDRLIAIEGSGWKGRRGSSLECRPRLLDFFRRYCRRIATRKMLHVTTLSFGSTAAAMELSVEGGRRMWQLKIGYQESLAPYYPGLHLTKWSIESTFSRGLDAYEFLGAAESWEQRWQPEERQYRLAVVYPLSVNGMVGACRDVAGSVWRRAQRTVGQKIASQRA